jgi:hypothetical protein
MTSLDFLKALSVLRYLILLIKRELNIQMPYKISLSAIIIKISFLSSLLISLHHESVNGGSCTKTNISIYRDCLTGILVGLTDIPIELIGILVEFTDMPIEVI